MAYRVMLNKKGQPDMRYACNRERFLKDLGHNLDGSADVRLSCNKDKIATKKEVERQIKPNVREDYFQVNAS